MRGQHREAKTLAALALPKAFPVGLLQYTLWITVFPMQMQGLGQWWPMRKPSASYSPRCIRTARDTLGSRTIPATTAPEAR